MTPQNGYVSHGYLISLTMTDATTAGSGSTIRPSALFVRSDLIKHLSTAKLFTWATGLGADPMGASEGKAADS